MAIQVLVHNKNTGEDSIDRYCSGECFLEHWAVDAADPCEMGEFECAECKISFSVTEVAPVSKFVMISENRDSFLLYPIEGIEDAIKELFEEESYTLKVLSLPTEAVDALPEFDGF